MTADDWIEIVFGLISGIVAGITTFLALEAIVIFVIVYLLRCAHGLYIICNFDR
jgi:hypothetical protein